MSSRPSSLRERFSGGLVETDRQHRIGRIRCEAHRARVAQGAGAKTLGAIPQSCAPRRTDVTRLNSRRHP